MNAFSPSQPEQAKLGLVWLKDLAEELEAEDVPLRLSSDIVDRLIIARLEHGSNQPASDPQTMTTSFEYLTGCWKRLQTTKTMVVRRGYSQADVASAMPVINKLKELIISYAGFSLQDPTMFYQPPGYVISANQVIPTLISICRKVAGSKELLGPLQGLASVSPLTSLSSSAQSSTTLEASEIEPFLADLAARFDGDGLDEILGPVFVDLSTMTKLDRHGLAGTGMADGWRSALAGLEGLVAVKPIAAAVRRAAIVHSFLHSLNAISR